jgi:hypothetical protein
VIGTILSAVHGVCWEVAGVLEGETKEMTKKRKLDEEQKIRPRKPKAEEQDKRQADSPRTETTGLASLQQLIGDRAVQRLLAQRSGA